jgi:hypothetical protein
MGTDLFTGRNMRKYKSVPVYLSAAADLLRALNAVEQATRQAYGEKPMTKLYGRYSLARDILEQYGPTKDAL